MSALKSKAEQAYNDLCKHLLTQSTNSVVQAWQKTCLDIMRDEYLAIIDMATQHKNICIKLSNCIGASQKELQMRVRDFVHMCGKWASFGNDILVFTGSSKSAAPHITTPILHCTKISARTDTSSPATQRSQPPGSRSPSVLVLESPPAAADEQPRLQLISRSPSQSLLDFMKSGTSPLSNSDNADAEIKSASPF